jgi:hypothetical protein
MRVSVDAPAMAIHLLTIAALLHNSFCDAKLGRLQEASCGIYHITIKSPEQSFRGDKNYGGKLRNTVKPLCITVQHLH